MKNICVILSGQPRNYKLGYQELKRTFLDRYKCDVVFHTWDAPTQSATQFFPNRPTNTYTFEDGWKEELLDLYKPIKYKFEQPIVFDNKNIVDPMWRQPLQNSKAMWYSVHQAFLLTPRGYDGYIRARFDIRYESSTSDIDKLDLSKVNLWDWDTDERVKHRGYYDVFAAGSYDSVGIYSDVFTKIDWYLNFDENYKRHLQGGWPGQDSGLRNEYLLRWHLTTSGVPVEVHKNSIPHADGHIIR